MGCWVKQPLIILKAQYVKLCSTKIARSLCKLCVEDIIIFATIFSRLKLVCSQTSLNGHLLRTPFILSKQIIFSAFNPLTTACVQSDLSQDKKQESVNLNMVETRDSVAETQRQTCVSICGYITVFRVSVAAFTTETDHFFTCFRVHKREKITALGCTLLILDYVQVLSCKELQE